MIFSSSETNNWIKIFIDNSLHLLINKSKLLSIQSWKYKNEFCIEIYYDTKSILCSYDNEEIWKGVLELFNNKITLLSN